MDYWTLVYHCFGITLSEGLILPDLNPGASKNTKISINTTAQTDSSVPAVPILLQIAVKCNLDIFYFQTPCMYTVLLAEEGKLSKEEFKTMWSNSEEGEFCHTIQALHASFKNAEDIKRRLENNNVFLIAGRVNENAENVMYYSSKSANGQIVLCEVRVPNPPIGIKVTCKATHTAYIPLFIQAVNFLLSTNS